MRETLPEERERLPLDKKAMALERERLPVERASLAERKREPPLVRATRPPNDGRLTPGAAARETHQDAPTSGAGGSGEAASSFSQC
jgi:hypothetical protein